jgi:hypothetical protein
MLSSGSLDIGDFRLAAVILPYYRPDPQRG